MSWDDIQTAEAVPTPAPTTPRQAPIRRPDGLRRALLTAGIAGALLVTGGVAVAFAASPDPSASPSPSATTDPSGGGTTNPERRGHDGQPCPDDGTGSGGTSGSNGSGGQSAEPTPSTATPAT